MLPDVHEPRTLRTLIVARYRTVYGLAAARLRRARDITMSPMSLVHNAFQRLDNVRPTQHWTTPQRFLGSFRNAMKWVLGDHVRRRKAKKRAHELASRDVDTVTGTYPFDLPFDTLEDALRHVAMEHPHGPRRRKVFDLVYVQGLSCDEAADVVGYSSRTVHRDALEVEERVRAHLSENGHHE